MGGLLRSPMLFYDCKPVGILFFSQRYNISNNVAGIYSNYQYSLTIPQCYSSFITHSSMVRVFVKNLMSHLNHNKNNRKQVGSGKNNRQIT